MLIDFSQFLTQPKLKITRIHTTNDQIPDEVVKRVTFILQKGNRRKEKKRKEKEKWLKRSEHAPSIL